MSNTFKEEENIKKLIKLFAKNTGCNLQEKGCPCNSCFHNQEADFKHICWLIILGLRGDYDVNKDNILKNIRKELNKKEVD